MPSGAGFVTVLFILFCTLLRYQLHTMTVSEQQLDLFGYGAR